MQQGKVLTVEIAIIAALLSLSGVLIFRLSPSLSLSSLIFLLDSLLHLGIVVNFRLQKNLEY